MTFQNTLFTSWTKFVKILWLIADSHMNIAVWRIFSSKRIWMKWNVLLQQKTSLGQFSRLLCQFEAEFLSTKSCSSLEQKLVCYDSHILCYCVKRCELDPLLHHKYVEQFLIHLLNDLGIFISKMFIKHFKVLNFRTTFLFIEWQLPNGPNAWLIAQNGYYLVYDV